jgi:hypothetical protein
MTETTKQTFSYSMCSLLQKSSCVPVIFKLGAANKQISQLTDEAKSKHKSTQASNLANNQHGVILEHVIVTKS